MLAATESTPFQTAEQHVYLYLRQRILSGELPGGTPINPVDVAATLSLSRMPVREALRQLDAEGLVTIMPNRRAVVTRLTAAEVEEIFEIRAVLEGLAIRFAVPNFDEVRLAELEVLNQFLNKARLDPRAWVQRHAEFHDYIVEVSGRQHLRKQIKRIHSAVQPYLLMYISVYQHTEMVGYEHDNIISLIRSGDPAVAEVYMIDHVRSASKGVIEYVTRREEGENVPGSGAKK
jgi:DNA-binding GntR family transcriptional regulator